MITIYPLYEGLPLIPTRAAITEMYHEAMDGYDVLFILENGYNCQKGKRSKKIREKCLDQKGKTIKAVVAKSHNISLESDVWVITHLGKTSLIKVKS